MLVQLPLEWKHFLSDDFLDENSIPDDTYSTRNITTTTSAPVPVSDSVVSAASGVMFNILLNYFGKK